MSDSTAICAAATALARAGGKPPVVSWSTAHLTANDGRLQRAVRDHFALETITLAIDDRLPFKALGDSDLLQRPLVTD